MINDGTTAPVALAQPTPKPRRCQPKRHQACCVSWFRPGEHLTVELLPEAAPIRAQVVSGCNVEHAQGEHY